MLECLCLVEGHGLNRQFYGGCRQYSKALLRRHQTFRDPLEQLSLVGSAVVGDNGSDRIEPKRDVPGVPAGA
jgi:hypothetical protein